MWRSAAAGTMAGMSATPSTGGRQAHPRRLPKRRRWLPLRDRDAGRPRRPAAKPPRGAAGEGPRAARNAIRRRARPAEGHAALPAHPLGAPRRSRARRDQDRQGVTGDRLRHLPGRRGRRQPRSAAGLEPRSLDGGIRPKKHPQPNGRARSRRKPERPSPHSAIRTRPRAAVPRLVLIA